MEPNENGQAQTGKGAESPLFNPIPLTEEGLAKLLIERVADKPVEETPKLEASTEAEAEEVVQDTEERPDVEVSDEISEAPSQEEEQEEKKSDEPEWFQKRIDKITARTKAAEEAAQREIAELRAKLEESETNSVRSPQSAPGSLEHIWDFGRLEQERANAREVKRWCDKNPEGGVVDGKEYSREDVLNIKFKTEDVLDEIPRRAEFLNRYHNAEQAAVSEYDFWKDRTSEKYRKAQAFLKEFPQLKMLPEHKILLGDFMAGMELRMAKKSAAKKAPVIAKVPPKQPSSTKTAPARLSPKKVANEEDRTAFFRTGSEQGLAKLLLGKI